jgi:hypothetical protein
MNYSLTVPTEIAERLPGTIQYACHVDETGIHYTPIESSTRPVETPSWAQANNGGGKPERKVSRQRPGKKAAAKT